MLKIFLKSDEKGLEKVVWKSGIKKLVLGGWRIILKVEIEKQRIQNS